MLRQRVLRAHSQGSGPVAIRKVGGPSHLLTNTARRKQDQPGLSIRDLADDSADLPQYGRCWGAYRVELLLRRWWGPTISARAGHQTAASRPALLVSLTLGGIRFTRTASLGYRLDCIGTCQSVTEADRFVKNRLSLGRRGHGFCWGDRLEPNHRPRRTGQSRCACGRKLLYLFCVRGGSAPQSRTSRPRPENLPARCTADIGTGAAPAPWLRVPAAGVGLAPAVLVRTPRAHAYSREQNC